MLTRVEGYNYPPCILCTCVCLRASVRVCLLERVCTSKRQCDRKRKSGYVNDCRAAQFVILLYLLAFLGCGLSVGCSETVTFSLKDDLVCPNLLFVCVLCVFPVVALQTDSLDISCESVLLRGLEAYIHTHTHTHTHTLYASQQNL